MSLIHVLIKVEVGNTDAEGRLVLADALNYAIEDQPDFMIDFATLTGAARVAFQYRTASILASNQDTANGLLGRRHSVDPLWQLPFFDDYDRHLMRATPLYPAPAYQAMARRLPKPYFCAGLPATPQLGAY